MGDKNFKGAPFGTQKARFDISAVHPQSKMPGTYTEVLYCKRATSKENRRLGPGIYVTERGSFTNTAIKLKSKGPNWKRAFECARLSALPHALYKNTWEQKKLLEEQLGPGRYKMRDFIEELDSRPSSSRGVCETKAARFQKVNKLQANIPGPGSYGDGGVPSAVLEKKERSSVSTSGMMEASSKRDMSLSNEGSGHPPGLYQYVSPTEQLLRKKVSSRGPYDLYTGPRIFRNKQMFEKRHLAPGKYEFKSFTEDLKNREKMKSGQFSTCTMYPVPPPERIYCSTLSQWPRQQGEPGPGYYSCDVERIGHSNTNQPAFNSSADRDSLDKISSKQQSLVGAGQYNIESQTQTRNGNCSVFRSLTPRLPPNVNSPMEKLLKERITPRGVSPDRRLFLLPNTRKHIIAM